MKDRITPENITELKENEIFIAATNLSGIHGAGSARLAYNKFGLPWGKHSGLYGQTYAIPTVARQIARSLTISEIKPFVEGFIKYAKFHSDKTFLVTAVGCGLAGITPEQIAPLFKEAIEIPNIHLPKSFWNILTTK